MDYGLPVLRSKTAEGGRTTDHGLLCPSFAGASTQERQFKPQNTPNTRKMNGLREEPGRFFAVSSGRHPHSQSSDRAALDSRAHDDQPPSAQEGTTSRRLEHKSFI